MPVNRFSLSRPTIAVLAAFTALSSGCGMFHHRTDYYSKAAESRPLDVPPDLDTPPNTNELIVPQAGAGASAAGGARASNVSAAPPASSASLSGGDLHVADSVAHTWQRVGLALERAQIGALSARDEKAHTYTLEFNSTVEVASGEHHWYSRVLHPFSGGGGKTQQVTSRLTVRISDDSGGARVSVEGDPSDKGATDSARRVVQVLRERLS